MSAEVEERLARERSSYLASWSATAATLRRDGHYAWMASFLEGRPLVLEIGTGSGESTLALLEAGHTVVGVEENPLCLERAERLIRDAGFGVVREHREELHASARDYAITYSRPTSRIERGTAVLLEGDTLNDDGLVEWLAASGPFDAIACWCIGSHPARLANSAVGERDERSYRFLVQDGAYELADRILAPGGLYHVVDRCGVVTDEVRRTLLRIHEDRARAASFEVDPEIAARPYASSGADGCSMVFVKGEGEKMPDFSAFSFASIVARKPSRGAR